MNPGEELPFLEPYQIMPTFVYRVKNRQGGVLRGELEAVDQGAALRALRQQDLFVTRIREKPGFSPEGWSFPGTARVSQNDLLVFTYQLEALIKAGVPLAQSLDMLETQAPSSALQAVLRDVKQEVKSGSSLTDALQGHPTVFTSWYVSMVQAGEESGTLDRTFGRLAEHLDKVVRLRQQVKLALAYPLLVVIVALLVLWVLLIWVIPMFATMFADWGDALPWPTAVVLGLSRWLQEQWVPVLLGVTGFGIGGRLWAKTKSGQRIIEDVALRVPLLGKLWRNVAVVHVARTLSVLLGSGVPILRGLEIAQKVSGLQRMVRALEEARSSIREGHTLADPLERSGMFPRLVSNMVGVGEATGSLDTALGNVADLFEREVDRDVAAFTAILEPLIIVVLGIGIGFIVVAMYLPIFSMPSMFD